MARSETGTTVALGGVHVSVPDGGTQVVTVHRTSGACADVRFWAKTDGAWVEELMTADGRIGSGGLVPGDERRQGTSTTPTGTFALPSTFGTHAASNDQKLPHIAITGDSYWVVDNDSAHYNRYRLGSAGGFRHGLSAGDINASERLADYPVQYEYAVVIDYNHDQVRHRGAAIFLHVNGSGATGGCVGVPRWMMKELFARLDPDANPVIAIGALSDRR